jgi:hypothetical protein
LRWDIAHASTADDLARRYAAPSGRAVLLLSFLVLSLTRSPRSQG